MIKQKSSERNAFERGLVGGGVVLLMALIGMIEVFRTRDIIGGLLTMAQVLVLGTFLLSALASARLGDGSRKSALVHGLISGGTSAAILAGLVILMIFVDMRRVFLNANPILMDILTFGQNPFLGALLLILTGVVIGLGAGALQSLPDRVRSPILSTLMIVLLIGLLADLLRVIVDQWGQVRYYMRWFFAGKGLSIPGTLVVIAVVSLFNFYRSRRPAGASKSFAQMSPRQRLLSIGAIAIILLSLPPLLGTYMSEVLTMVGIYILMGLGLNIVVGFAGLLDLGYVAFYAIGAYTMGVLTSPELSSQPLTWFQALPFALVIATLSGFLLGIPVLRMRGDYLAIVTLGFGEIIRILALSDLLKPFIGGSQGIQLIARPAIGSFVFADQQRLYYIILVACLLAVVVATRLRDSRLGRAWMAMREDEDVAEAMGINLLGIKLLAFASGAAISGLGGMIFAAKLGSAYPHSFHLLVSINVLCLIIVGGIGSIPGVLVGALALVGLPELLREFGEYRLLVYGALLVYMMLARPEGLWPEEGHKRELHADEFAPAPAATD
jgi:branched-chain amino acid transport system permease protein